MPVVQEIPLQKHDQEKERKTQRSRSQHQGEEVIRLQLGAGVQDRVAQASLPYSARPGKELPRDRADNRNTGRNADADKERRHGVGKTKPGEDL